MPALIVRREFAKSVIDSIVRKALKSVDRKTRYAFQRLLCEVQSRSEMLRPSRFIGRVEAEKFLPIVNGLLGLNNQRKEWLRTIDGWEPEESNPYPLFSSLAHHLLADYPVPPILLSAWFEADSWSARRHQSFFIQAGRGKSLREIGLPIALNRRMAHEFAKAPAHFPIDFALRWAQVRGLGGSSSLAEAVASSELGPARRGDDFWRSVIQFLINHPDVEHRHIDPLVAYLDHQKFEPIRVIVGEDSEVTLDPPQPDLSIKGWSSASLLRRVEEWQARQVPPPARRYLEWAPTGFIGHDAPDGEGRRWRVREILDSDTLAAEGKAMNHCAATYTDVCRRRTSSLWSMRFEAPEGDERVLTIEVSPETKLVVQAKMKDNDEPDTRSLAVLADWAARAGLRVEL